MPSKTEQPIEWDCFLKPGSGAARERDCEVHAHQNEGLQENSVLNLQLLFPISEGRCRKRIPRIPWEIPGTAPILPHWPSSLCYLSTPANFRWSATWRSQ